MIINLRLDLFLKYSRLALRRTLAQQMCEGGAVKINGVRAKSAREVREGDEITIRQRALLTTVRVARIPQKPPSKALAASLYETVREERINPEPDPLWR